jgi:hypothetical protein
LAKVEGRKTGTTMRFANRPAAAAGHRIVECEGVQSVIWPVFNGIFDANRRSPQRQLARANKPYVVLPLITALLQMRGGDSIDIVATAMERRLKAEFKALAQIPPAQSLLRFNPKKEPERTVLRLTTHTNIQDHLLAYQLRTTAPGLYRLCWWLRRGPGTLKDNEVSTPDREVRIASTQHAVISLGGTLAFWQNKQLSVALPPLSVADYVFVCACCFFDCLSILGVLPLSSSLLVVHSSCMGVTAARGNRHCDTRSSRTLSCLIGSLSLSGS